MTFEFHRQIFKRILALTTVWLKTIDVTLIEFLILDFKSFYKNKHFQIHKIDAEYWTNLSGGM